MIKSSRIKKHTKSPDLLFIRAAKGEFVGMLSVNSSGSNINEKEYDVVNNTNKFNDNVLRILMYINPVNIKVA